MFGNSVLTHKYFLLYSVGRDFSESLSMDVLSINSRLESLIARHSLWSYLVRYGPANPALCISASVSFLDSLLKFIKHSIRVVHT